jgi:hypothetical protein
MRRFRTAFGFTSTLALQAAPTAIKAQATADDGWVGEGVAQKASDFATRRPARARSRRPPS